MDVTINGRRVTLRGKLPAADNWDMLAQFGQTGEFDLRTMTFEQVTDLFRRFVESWEYDGDPASIDSYRELDLFKEYMPLMSAVSERMKAVFGEGKN